MKYACVLQHNEEDCGAACLATTRQALRTHLLHSAAFAEAVGTGQAPRYNFARVCRRGSETLGFDARPVKGSTRTD